MSMKMSKANRDKWQKAVKGLLNAVNDNNKNVSELINFGFTEKMIEVLFNIKYLDFDTEFHNAAPDINLQISGGEGGGGGMVPVLSPDQLSELFNRLFGTEDAPSQRRYTALLGQINARTTQLIAQNNQTTRQMEELQAYHTGQGTNFINMLNDIVSQLYSNGYFNDFENLTFPNNLDAYLQTLVDAEQLKQFINNTMYRTGELTTKEAYREAYYPPENATPEQINAAKQRYKDYMMQVFKRGSETYREGDITKYRDMTAHKKINEWVEIIGIKSNIKRTAGYFKSIINMATPAKRLELLLIILNIATSSTDYKARYAQARKDNPNSGPVTVAVNLITSLLGSSSMNIGTPVLGVQGDYLNLIIETIKQFILNNSPNATFTSQPYQMPTEEKKEQAPWDIPSENDLTKEINRTYEELEVGLSESERRSLADILIFLSTEISTNTLTEAQRANIVPTARYILNKVKNKIMSNPSDPNRGNIFSIIKSIFTDPANRQLISDFGSVVLNPTPAKITNILNGIIDDFMNRSKTTSSSPPATSTTTAPATSTTTAPATSTTTAPTPITTTAQFGSETLQSNFADEKYDDAEEIAARYIAQEGKDEVEEIDAHRGQFVEVELNNVRANPLPPSINIGMRTRELLTRVGRGVEMVSARIRNVPQFDELKLRSEEEFEDQKTITEIKTAEERLRNERPGVLRNIYNSMTNNFGTNWRLTRQYYLDYGGRMIPFPSRRAANNWRLDLRNQAENDGYMTEIQNIPEVIEKFGLIRKVGGGGGPPGDPGDDDMIVGGFRYRFRGLTKRNWVLLVAVIIALSTGAVTAEQLIKHNTDISKDGKPIPAEPTPAPAKPTPVKPTPGKPPVPAKPGDNDVVFPSKYIKIKHNSFWDSVGLGGVIDIYNTYVDNYNNSNLTKGDKDILNAKITEYWGKLSKATGVPELNELIKARQTYDDLKKQYDNATTNKLNFSTILGIYTSLTKSAEYLDTMTQKYLNIENGIFGTAKSLTDADVTIDNRDDPDSFVTKMQTQVKAKAIVDPSQLLLSKGMMERIMRKLENKGDFSSGIMNETERFNNFSLVKNHEYPEGLGLDNPLIRRNKEYEIKQYLNANPNPRPYVVPSYNKCVQYAKGEKPIMRNPVMIDDKLDDAYWNPTGNQVKLYEPFEKSKLFNPEYEIQKNTNIKKITTLSNMIRSGPYTYLNEDQYYNGGTCEYEYNEKLNNYPLTSEFKQVKPTKIYKITPKVKKSRLPDNYSIK